MSELLTPSPAVHEPRNVALLVERAWQKLSEQDYNNAEQAFRQASALDAHAFEPYYGLGLVLKKTGKGEASQQAFIQAQRYLGASGIPRDQQTILRRLLRWYLEGAITAGEKPAEERRA